MLKAGNTMARGYKLGVYFGWLISDGESASQPGKQRVTSYQVRVAPDLGLLDGGKRPAQFQVHGSQKTLANSEEIPTTAGP